MRLGLIARADDRGIANQTWEMYRHLKPARTMVVMMNDPAWPEDRERFAGPGVTHVQSDYQTRLLPREAMSVFLDGINVLFSVETMYDWRILDMARQRGVKTIIASNPEFCIHGSHPELPSPDVWAWPTPWLLNHELIPHGPIIPVPTVTRPQTAADPYDPVLRVLHVAGAGAAGDRNGTSEFIQAIPSISERVHITMVGQTGAFPMQVRHGPNVTVDANPHGVEDRWDLYHNQHILMSPRKYGGLHLPALEAMATGMCVIMPNCSPNEIWPGPRITSRKARQQRSPMGSFDTFTVHPMDIATTINRLAVDRDQLACEMQLAAGYAEANNWDKLKKSVYDPLTEG